jgi:c-di-GMP-binding flagellar brake protein YcgR
MDERYSEVERRKFDRLKVDFSIIYQVNKPWYLRVLIGGKEVEATALDVGAGGLAVSTNYDIPVSTVLAITIMIYNVVSGNNFKFYKTILAQGKVCSNVAQDKGVHRIGINFLEIDPEGKKELLDFARIKKDQNPLGYELG